MYFLLTATEWVTSQIDIVTGVIQNSWAQMLGIVGIPMISSIIINQTWGTIRSAIQNKRARVNNFKVTEKITQAVDKIQTAKNDLENCVVEKIKSGFESVEIKNEKLNEKKKMLEKEAIKKILETSKKADIILDSEKINNELIEFEKKANEFIDNKLEIADEKVEVLAEKAQVKETKIVKAIEEKAEDFKDKVKEKAEEILPIFKR